MASPSQPEKLVVCDFVRTDGSLVDVTGRIRKAHDLGKSVLLTMILPDRHAIGLKAASVVRLVEGATGQPDVATVQFGRDPTDTATIELTDPPTIAFSKTMEPETP